MKYELTYSDNIEFGGICYYPKFPLWGTCRVVLKPKYKNDLGLLKHELKHVEQYVERWYQGIWYKLSKKYRYKCELEAYTVQIKEYKYTTLKQCEWVISAIVEKYNLKVTRAEVSRDLQLVLDAR